MTARARAWKKVLSPTYNAAWSPRRRLVIFVALLLWSGLVWTLFGLAWVFGRFSPHWRAALAGRLLGRERAAVLARERATYARLSLFFCSSAGEYEQALPLIERLRSEPGHAVQLVFFSLSGPRFLAARATSEPYLLAPPDTLGQWQRLFAALRPEAVFVVRHELWPAFLYTAREAATAPLFLLNASVSLTDHRRSAARLMKRWLLRFFSRIFAVDEADARFFAEVLAYPRDLLCVTGDSKYDRVFERQAERTAELQSLRTRLDGTIPAESRLVVGSAWEKDVTLALDGLLKLKELAGPPTAKGRVRFQLVVVLHEPTADALAGAQAACERRALSHRRFSVVLGGEACEAQAVEVLLVDALGVLAELYGLAHLAFIGGALHNKVHNVLEPASYGLALAFGPLYKNSGEARALVDEGLARVIEAPAAFALWWQEMLASSYASGVEAQACIRRRCGAAERILREVRTNLRPDRRAE